MRYLGLDVHKRVVQACTLDEGGRTLHALRFDLTRDTLTEFARRHLDDDCAVALEATTNTWAIVDVLTPFCPRIVVSNPMRTKAIASAKIKTDKVDAEVLAQLLRCDYLPTVWTPDAQTREQRALASRRSALTRQAISLKNRIHSVLHQRLIFGPAELFSTKGLAWLRSTELPPIARGEIDTLLRLLDALQIEQASLRVDVDRAAFASQDIKLLMTLPGIDATTAHAIMAAIGDIHRFRSPDRLAAYFGLVPSVHQSAEHAYHGRITKQGNSNVRWLLIQAAQIAGRHPGPLGKQFATLARRKNRNVAVVAIAHKLAILAWHLLRRTGMRCHVRSRRSLRACGSAKRVAAPPARPRDSHDRPTTVPASVREGRRPSTQRCRMNSFRLRRLRLLAKPASSPNSNSVRSPKACSTKPACRAEELTPQPRRKVDTNIDSPSPVNPRGSPVEA